MNNHGCHSYNTLEHTFYGNRIMNRHMSPVKWELVINLTGIEVTGEQAIVDHQRLMVLVAYQTIQWWVSNYVCDIFITGLDDSLSHSAFFDAEYDNVFVTLPYSPTDDIFLEALHSKISVLAEGYLHIVNVTLRSSDYNSTYYFSKEAGYRLAMDNSILNGVSLHDTPWWGRKDCDMWEPVMVDDLTKEELYDAVETFSELQSIESEILSVFMGESEENLEEDAAEKKEKAGEVIGIKKWKPRPV